MKNLSFRFTLAVSAILLFGGLIRGNGASVAVAVFLSPLGMITMLLSFKLHRPIAHILNMIPAALWLVPSVVYLINRDAGDLMVMASIAYSPLLLIGIIASWLQAWSLRGQSEMELIDTHIRGRRAELVLPQPSPTLKAERIATVDTKQP